MADVQDLPGAEADELEDGGEQLGEDSGNGPLQDITKLFESLRRALQNQTLFQDCGPAFAEAVLSRGERLTLKPGEELPVTDGGPLYIVETGCVRVQVGGPEAASAVVGTGSVLNTAGFLELIEEAENYRPRRLSLSSDDKHPRSTRADGYDVQGFDGPPPSLFKFRRGAAPTPEEMAAGPTNAQLCFFNLCPYAARASSHRASVYPVTLVGADVGEFPTQTGKHDCLVDGGATVVALLSKKQVLDLGRTAKGEFNDKSLETFRGNCNQLYNTWKALMPSVTSAILPGAPAEVVLAIAEIAKLESFATGAAMVTEGTCGEEADSIIIISEGVAMVEKRTATVAGIVRVETIGRLRQGALIGAMSLIGASVPRGATVRAKTDVEALSIEAPGLLHVLARFPGVLEGCRQSLLEVADFWQERLLTPTEVVSTLNIFAGCDLRFVNDMANAGERRILFCGETVVAEGSTAGTLFVLEHGRCNIEIAEYGKVAEVPVGNCFGERTLLGIAPRANATVRVSTPFAMVLAIPRAALQQALELHPNQQAHFDRLKDRPAEGRVAGVKVRHVELFRPCGAGLMDALGAACKVITFLPGQSIVVEGDIEADPRMFVLAGGTIAAELRGRPLARMTPGATFGELAMLGLSKERSVTVRAITLCTVMAISSSAFFEALQHFPDEQERFEEVLTNNNYNSRVDWPCLHGLPARLLYLLDLYGEKVQCLANSTRLDMPPLNEAALLVLEGSISVVNRTGQKVDVIGVGRCFNEQTLVDAPIDPELSLIPVTDCEVRVLTRDTWEKVMAEFPQDQDRVRKTILTYMADQAEKELGLLPGTTELLQKSSAFFSTASDAIALAARALIETRIHVPNTDIVLSTGPKSKKEGGCEELLILLSGKATLQTALETRQFKPGEAIGEAVMFGAARHYHGTLHADGVCLLHVLKRLDFEQAVANAGEPGDQELVEELAKESQPLGVEQLQKRLAWSYSFKGAQPEFLAALCRCPEVLVFPPSTTVLEQGEECVVGKSDCYLVLAGRIRAEGEAGTLFGLVTAGQAFGEVGALGLIGKRTARARTWDDSLVCCLKISGLAVARALEMWPTAVDFLNDKWKKLMATNKQTEHRRRVWIKEVAVPTLGRTPLFAGCTKTFLNSVAIHLEESQFQAGQIIAKAGSTLQSMLMILKGSAHLEAADGAKIARLQEGSVFGEVNAIGLFTSCMATVRAYEPCTIMAVTEAALKEALSQPGSDVEEMRRCFQRLIDCRHFQVARGLPIAGLSFSASADDVCVRALALLSERILLHPGELWQPVPEEDPCGPCTGILVSGRALVAIGEDDHPVMQLTPGAIFREGLLAAHGAHIRAEAISEGYRIRRCNFDMAVAVTNTTKSWFWSFKLEEKELNEKLRQRLASVKGLIEGAAPQPRDGEIQAWKLRRCQSIKKAQLLRQDKDGQASKLPSLAGSLSSSQIKYSSKLAESASSWVSLDKRHPGLMALASAYPVLQLPRLPKKPGPPPQNESRNELLQAAMG